MTRDLFFVIEFWVGTSDKNILTLLLFPTKFGVLLFFMSDSNNIITIQRDKNQITLPSSIVKKIGAKKGTKYRLIINQKGNMEFVIIKNDIRKYMGSLKNQQSAVQMIRQERQKDDQKALNW